MMTRPETLGYIVIALNALNDYAVSDVLSYIEAKE